MPLPAVLGALGRVASGASRLGGALGESKAAQGLSNAGNIAFSVQSIASGLKMIGTAAVEAMNPISLFTKAMGLVQAPALAVVKSLGAFRDTVTALGNSVSEFVRLASPVHVQRFTLAAEDLTASIGKFLIPVLEFATKMTRSFADVIFVLSGPLQKLVNSVMKPLISLFDTFINTVSPLVRLLGTLWDTIAGFLNPIGTLIAALGKLIAMPLAVGFQALEMALTPLLQILQVAAMLLGDFADAVSRFVDRMTGGLFGSSIRDRSVGAAVRPAQIGSVEDYGRRAQQAAFSLGTGATPEERTANVVQKLYDKCVEFFGKVPAFIAQIIKALVPDASDVTDALGATGGNPLEIGRNLADWDGTVKAPTPIADLVNAARERARIIEAEIRARERAALAAAGP